jgi:hypothetical protein
VLARRQSLNAGLRQHGVGVAGMDGAVALAVEDDGRDPQLLRHRAGAEAGRTCWRRPALRL